MSKADVTSEVENWAKEQDEETQGHYATYKQSLEELKDKHLTNHQKLAENLTADALELDQQIQDIMNNQEISLSEECSQIKELLKKASTSIRKEIRETFGEPPACEKRHGGGSSGKGKHQNGDKNAGGQGGAGGGGNGGFGQQGGNFGGGNPVNGGNFGGNSQGFK
ncbi:SXP/RAL-2 protein [Aphelenchoides avenae]|nr:SXP/RAL-2 protein [Aphelenchus avenae]